VRSHNLESQDFQVLRFWNNDALKDITLVLDVILTTTCHHYTGSPRPSQTPSK
ncbi:MAG: DUF559 domain-containing protein, partial [Chloroflexi bacterium]|nr:DUF559 domain-containing protein [Chloroflexota bacterium]